MRSPGGGVLSLSACPGVGNRPPSEKKIANPRGYARGGWQQVELNHALRLPNFVLAEIQVVLNLTAMKITQKKAINL